MGGQGTGPFLPIDPAFEFDDEASNVVNTVIAEMLRGFNPNDVNMPPLGGGSTTVRFVTGSIIALELWDAHTDGGQNCNEPFLWVQLRKRFRFTSFPNVETGVVDCTAFRAITLEIGVGRCSHLSPEIDWPEMQQEAEISISDSWRLEIICCNIIRQMKSQNRLIAIGEITPVGPEGGVIAWTATLNIKL
jgi:hypothetical protein